MQRICFTPLRHSLLRPTFVRPSLLIPVRRYTVQKTPYQHTIAPTTTPPSVPPNTTPPPPPPIEPSKETQQFHKIFNKTPKFLRKWLEPIANKPLSHITSFLLLHELTAIIPLISLTYIFHKAQWTPPVLPGEWLVQGVEKGAKLIRHYGVNIKGDEFVRLAFEFAAAYASVKILLPLRIVLSVWATPWFARAFVIPFLNLFRWRRKKARITPNETKIP